MNDMGELNYYFGISVRQNKADGTVERDSMEAVHSKTAGEIWIKECKTSGDSS